MMGEKHGSMTSGLPAIATQTVRPRRLVVFSNLPVSLLSLLDATNIMDENRSFSYINLYKRIHGS